MLDAMARAVAEKGYEKTSVADVVSRAGVSRKTFYEQFEDKETCFLAAYETIFGELAAAAFDAYESRRRWPDRMAAGLAAFLDRLGAEPAYAKAGIVEVLAAGPRAIELRDRLLRGFHSYFDPSRPEVPDHGLPRIVAEATVGGIYEVIYRRIVSQGPEAWSELLPELTYLALAPFVGPKAAFKTAGLDPWGGAARSA
jgi:AcrR family transcriptional regulator